MPSWPLAALVFPLGYVPVALTDSRLLRPIVLLPLAATLFVWWARTRPAPRVALLLAIFLGCFVLSHVVAAATVPALGVAVAAVLFAAAAWALADRPAAWRPART